MKSGARRFVCNACKSASSPSVLASPNDDYGVPLAAALLSTPSRTAAATLPRDLGAELLSLRALLVDALEGIPFLSDQVAKLGEDNERLRRDNATKAAAHADVVKTLREEVRALRTDLTRMRGAPPSLSASRVPPAAIGVDRGNNTRHSAEHFAFCIASISRCQLEGGFLGIPLPGRATAAPHSQKLRAASPGCWCL